MADYGYDHNQNGDPLPKGWVRVRHALMDRLDTHTEANAITREWEDSRFGPSDALRYIVEHGCIRPSGAEAVR